MQVDSAQVAQNSLCCSIADLGRGVAHAVGRRLGGALVGLTLAALFIGSAQAQVVNNINIFVGNKTETATDYSDPAGHLGFARHYTSVAVPNNPGSTLGSRWRHSYQASLLSGGTSIRRLNRPSGNSYVFRLVGADWVPDADISERLVAVTDGGGQVLAWRVTSLDNRVEQFNAAGQLERIEYPDGDIVQLTYDASGRPERISDRRGRALVLTYAGTFLETVTLPDGKLLAYTFDAQQRLGTASYEVSSGGTPQFTGVQYRYEDANDPQLLTGVIDEAGQRYLTWGYDAQGRATSTRRGDPAGNVDRLDITYGTGQSSTTNALGDTATAGYQVLLGRAKLISNTKSCTSCGGSSQTRTYDANGYPDVTTDFAGVTTDHDYNARGLLTQKIESANQAATKRATQTDWHPTMAVPTERRTYDAAGALIAKSAWTLNARGQALTSTQTDPVTASTRTSTTTYCEQADVDASTCPLVGLLKSTDGPRTDVADVSSYTYRMADEASCATAPTTCAYRKGDLWKVTNALGQVAETVKFDGAGRVLSVKDADGVITDMEYHPRGWLTASKVRGTNAGSEADDLVTRIEYEPTGLVKKTTLPDGSSTGFIYDAAHRLTDITDGEGNRIHYTLDNAGNKTKEDTLASNGSVQRTLSRVYNQLGQLQTGKDAYARATGFSYDASGNTNTVTDALGRVTDNDYDPLNRLTKTIQNLGGINASTQFQYDARDNLTAVTDPKGLSTGYTYNGLGDLTKLTSPDTGVTNFTYDSAGNRKTQTDARSKLTTYGYDVLNRLTTIGYATTSLNVTYTYDLSNTVCTTDERFSTGRLTKLQDGSGTTQYCYDRFGQLTRKVQTTNGKVFTLRYAYTKAGQLSALTYPNGTVVDYPRDALGRATSVGVTLPGGARQVLLQQAAYYPFGPAGEWVFGNGRLFQRTLNQNYQPGVVQDGFPGGLSVGYEFDEVGNLSKLRNGNQNDPPQRLFGYDALNRLTDAKDGTSTLLQGYTYDATGNRTGFTYTRGTHVYSYPADSHRLGEVGGEARTYDAAGNTTSIGGTARQFVYNAAGRMSQTERDNEVAMQYAYNGKGEQVRRYLGTVNTYTAYDEAGHWLGDYDTAGAPLQQAIWLDDLPVGVIIYGQLHYVEADALGTPRVVIEPQRDVAVWSWDLTSEAFGNSPPNQDPDGDTTPFVFDLRYPGQRYDSATQLNYNMRRDYEPGVGRYVQSDPIGLGDGPATYAYVGSAPVSFADPSGKSRRAAASTYPSSYIEIARQEAVAKLQRCNIDDCAPNNPYKISKAELQQVIQKVISADISYDPEEQVCGWSVPNSDQYGVVLGATLRIKGKCCPLASVIAHEAAHLVFGHPFDIRQQTTNEGKARFVQEQCFGCSRAFH